MRFNGSSGVEVRPPDNLDDLKGYTSLSLYLQRPLSRLDSPRRQTSNMFVMYLGDKDVSIRFLSPLFLLIFITLFTHQYGQWVVNI